MQHSLLFLSCRQEEKRLSRKHKSRLLLSLIRAVGELEAMETETGSTKSEQLHTPRDCLMISAFRLRWPREAMCNIFVFEGASYPSLLLVYMV
eukprot:1140597-Pelagomonas_calceolata.AAC.4